MSTENNEYWDENNIQNEINNNDITNHGNVENQEQNIKYENNVIETKQRNKSELSEIEKRKLRAKRFGLPESNVKLSDKEKIEQRRKRFGLTAKEGNKDKKKIDIEVIKRRQERFGITKGISKKLSNAIEEEKRKARQRRFNMSTFVISAPAEKSKEEVINSLRSKIAGQAEIRPFSLPEFKIGTLDSLVVLSDDLGKYDQAFEGITTKIAENLKSLLHGDVDQWEKNLIVDDKTVDNYLKGFQWNDMKYRTDKSLREICDIIVQDVNSIDSLMKSRMTKYNLIKSQLTSLQRKQNGNLSVKSLVDIVKKEHFVLNSEYLVTLIVAVPKNLIKEWYASYETLCPMVVPRSSELIAQDDDYGLFNVTLFQKVVEDFKKACRERKYQVRDFTFDENKINQEQKDLAAISAEEKDQWQTSLRLCKANFGESFSCWMHIKALRVYVESILRYGLPPNFQPMIIKPKNKNERRVREILAQHYANLGERNDGDKKSKKKEQIDENIQMLLGDKEYYPYVSFDINWKI